jgi:hypothetical protein
MIVVSDTSPLCYLLLINRVELLPQLYGKQADLQKTTFRTSPALIQFLLKEFQDECKKGDLT